jgi:hypothetical protein
MPCQNGTIQPRPISAVARTEGTQVIFGLDVLKSVSGGLGTRKKKDDAHQPNQKRPMGRRMAPAIIGGSRSSGMALPCFLNARVKFVAVEKAIMPEPSRIPTTKATKGREATPRFHPRSSWNEIGY